ncbi:MAG: acyltransferase [Thermoleophilaceae bacterium]
MIPLRERLDPRGFGRRNIDSAWWHWLVNVTAASPALDRETRSRLLRRAGIDVGHAVIDSGVYFFSADVNLGDWSVINHRCYFDSRDHIEVGERTGLAMEVMLCTSFHEIGTGLQRLGNYRTGAVTVGEGCWLGTRVTVLPGVTIGDGCVVGAGAVVTEDLEPHGVYAGVPARLVRELEPA